MLRDKHLHQLTWASLQDTKFLPEEPPLNSLSVRASGWSISESPDYCILNRIMSAQETRQNAPTPPDSRPRPVPLCTDPDGEG